MKHLTMGVRRSQLKITDHYDTEITFGGRVDFLVLFLASKFYVHIPNIRRVFPKMTTCRNRYGKVVIYGYASKKTSFWIIFLYHLIGQARTWVCCIKNRIDIRRGLLSGISFH